MDITRKRRKDYFNELERLCVQDFWMVCITQKQTVDGDRC